MGTVPAAKPVPATPAPARSRPFASPLEAQRAEAEAAERAAFVFDDPAIAFPPQAPVPSSAPVLSPRDPYSSVRAAATAAWLSLEAKEIEVRKYFRSVAVPTGLELLAKMRKQCDLAAETLQQRMDEGNTERCTGCGKTLEECHKSQWIMQGADVDAETGVPMPYRFCGPLCVRERNREKMLPKELRDQKRFDGTDIAEVR
jgi:hypothetical protein